MKTLIEDYERRLKTVEDMIHNFKSSWSIDDIRKDERLKTKAAEFRTFIAEMERELKNFKEKVFDTLVEFAPEADAIEVQKFIIKTFA